MSKVLSRSEIFDLYVMNRDAEKALGLGFLPPAVSRIFEKYALLGADSISEEAVQNAFADYTRAYEEVVNLSET